MPCDWALAGAAEVIRHHHERFDGLGYPDGLRGEAIPRNARIFAVVDVFDALTSTRPYKTAMPFKDALAIIGQGAGRHFDPEVAAAFRQIAAAQYGDIAQISEEALQFKMRAVLFRYFRIDTALEELPLSGGRNNSSAADGPTDVPRKNASK